MSQAKVDKYKEEKANRKKTMKKEKIMKTVVAILAILVIAAPIVWVGYSAVDTIIKNQPRESVEVDYTALDDYATEIAE